MGRLIELRSCDEEHLYQMQCAKDAELYVSNLKKSLFPLLGDTLEPVPLVDAIGQQEEEESYYSEEEEVLLLPMNQTIKQETIELGSIPSDMVQSNASKVEFS